LTYQRNLFYRGTIPPFNNQKGHEFSYPWPFKHNGHGRVKPSLAGNYGLTPEASATSASSWPSRSP